MKPKVPNKIHSSIKEITPQTWNQLIDCITYAMDHPRGDGHSIFLDASSGMLKLRKEGKDNIADDEQGIEPSYYAIPYYPFFDPDANEIIVNGGRANMNGTMVDVAPVRMTILEGYICVCSANRTGKPMIKYANPSADNRPIVYCEKQGEEWVIERLHDGERPEPLFLHFQTC